MAEYRVPAGPGEGEYVEKRSRFIGAVWPVSTEAEARACIENTKKRYHDARHNCWCYRLKDGVERYSDDGEPQGTAGIPMLSLFQKAGVTGVVCVVTRYFGGVLLGAGGLVRAYTQAAGLALEDAGVSTLRPWDKLEFPCPYALLESVRLLAGRHRGVVQDVQYGEDVTFTLLFPREDTEAFTAALTELTAGAVSVRRAGTVERAGPL